MDKKNSPFFIENKDRLLRESWASVKQKRVLTHFQTGQTHTLNVGYSSRVKGV